jgi:hypothetical protein
LAVTRLGLEGSTTGYDRTAEVKMAWPSPHLNAALGEHLLVSSATEPGCIDSQIQGNIIPSATAGQYFLGVNITNPSTPNKIVDGCDGTMQGTFSSGVTSALVLQSTPRYKVAIHSFLFSPPGLTGRFDASLTDASTGIVLQTIPSTVFVFPAWYNQTGKRYAIGGVRDASRVANFDNFVGTAN